MALPHTPQVSSAIGLSPLRHREIIRIEVVMRAFRWRDPGLYLARIDRIAVRHLAFNDHEVIELHPREFFDALGTTDIAANRPHIGATIRPDLLVIHRKGEPWCLAAGQGLNLRDLPSACPAIEIRGKFLDRL
jgi:hypothetical protein